MPLKLEKKPSGIWKIRGTHHGILISESARTRNRAEAQTILKAREKEIFIDVYKLGPPEQPKQKTFGDAALGYLESGKGGPYDIGRVLQAMGDIPLNEITQGYIDQQALTCFPDVKPATRLRAFYAPVSAILDFAQGERWMPAFRIKKPKPSKGRTDWLTPIEAEVLIKEMRGLSAMVTFLIGTGPRISEACRLQWKDVSPDNHEATFYGTKSGHPRQVKLCARTRAVMPPRRGPEDPVWTHDNGEGWAMSQDGRYYGPRVKMVRRCKQLGLRHTTPHMLRHTWASWQYSLHKDPLRLMRDGGWQSLDLVQRYTHTGTDDLNAHVIYHGWFDHDGLSVQNTSKIAG